jgi:hypothetical protein
MSERALLYPSGAVIDGIVRYRCQRQSRKGFDVETTRRFRFFTPLPTKWRAMQRLKDVIEEVYGSDLAPGWEFSYQMELPVEAPEEMRGKPEQFLPLPAEAEKRTNEVGTAVDFKRPFPRQMGSPDHSFAFVKSPRMSPTSMQARAV